MGAQVTLVGPPTLLSRQMQEIWPSITISHDLDEVLPHQDAVMMLRCQFERGTGAFIPGQGEYVRFYQLNGARMKRCKPDVAVLHPGPINRGVEITSEVADSPNSLILEQVTNGVPVRMAVMFLLCHPHGEQVP
jgi:aspartate carbamoyltransferase catalytic subunit